MQGVASRLPLPVALVVPAFTPVHHQLVEGVFGTPMRTAVDSRRLFRDQSSNSREVGSSSSSRDSRDGKRKDLNIDIDIQQADVDLAHGGHRLLPCFLP